MIHRHVVYDNDADGFCSALAFYTLSRETDDLQDYNDLQDYTFYEHGHSNDDFPTALYDNLEDWDGVHVVYLLDLHLSRFAISNIKMLTTSLVVIDHHESAANWLADMGHPQDTTRASCIQTWEEMLGYVPEIIEYVGRRDVWDWSLPYTDEVNSYLQILANDFATWYSLLDELDNGHVEMQDLINIGEAIVLARQTAVNFMLTTTSLGEFDIYNYVPMCNATYYHSEVGHALLDRHPTAPFVLLYSVSGNKIKFSFRSEDHREDVSKLAVKYGGGGHRNAAGFTTTLEEGGTWIAIGG